MTHVRIFSLPVRVNGGAVLQAPPDASATASDADAPMTTVGDVAAAAMQRQNAGGGGGGAPDSPPRRTGTSSDVRQRRRSDGGGGGVRMNRGASRNPKKGHDELHAEVMQRNAM